MMAQLLWHVVSSRDVRRLGAAAVLLLLVLLLLSPGVTSAYTGLGGYLSEKLLGQAGNASSLYLGSSASGPVVLGAGPGLSTTPVTDAIFPESGPTTATLRGTLDLNGAPRADVWFRWGDSPTTLTNVTATVTVTTAGEKTAAISGYDPGGRVYYQFAGTTDGTSYSNVGSFTVGGGRGTAFWMLWNILTMLIACSIFVFVLVFSHNLVVAILTTIIGILAMQIVLAMLQSLL